MTPEGPFVELAELVRENVTGDAPPEVEARGRAKLVDRIARAPGAPKRRGLVRRLGPAFAIAAAFALAIGGAAVRLSAPSPLEVRAGAAPLVAGAFVHAHEADDVLAFSDGSEAVLLRGGALRLAHVDGDGAELALERGHVRLSVHHHDGTRWIVHAGPVSVTVRGTVLDVGWRPSANEVTVRVDEGLVEVAGGVLSGPVFVAGGQSLRLHGEEVVLGPTPETPPEPTIEPAAAVAAPDGAPAPPTTAELAPPATPAKSWAKRVGEGDFAGVLADAEARGVDGVLASAPLGDLVALGDAARYGRRGDLANRALHAQRKRFPGTGAAATAAFLLGRVADDGGRTAEAVGYFDLYLAEAPGGAFAAEALGRKMLAVEKTSGAAAARSLAETYLSRYPRGAHTAAAQRIASP